MLFADKRALQTSLKLNLMEIREKELNFYTNNCLHIGFLATIFAGFASTALMTHVPKDPKWLHFLYLLFTVAALGLQLASIVSTTLLAMVAPGLALRGPDGSMNQAIDSLIGEYRTAFFQLLCGLFALHLSVISFAWLRFDYFPEAPVTTIAVVAAGVFELRYIRTVFRAFPLPTGQLVTGKFEGMEASLTGADAGLVDAGEINTLSHLVRQEGGGGGWQEKEAEENAAKEAMAAMALRSRSGDPGQIVE